MNKHRWRWLTACSLLGLLVVFAMSSRNQSAQSPHEFVPSTLPMDAVQWQVAKRAPINAKTLLPDQSLDPALLAQARLSAKRMTAKASAAWRSHGPDDVGGRVRTFDFDPRNADRMLAGGVSGGVFESTDGGKNWRPIGDTLPSLNIGALIFNPAQPDEIFVGTGELYRNSARPYSAMWGQGILRSRDNGKSFQPLLATQNSNFRYVSDLVMSTAAPNRLYAATNAGVFRSDDGGNSFALILAINQLPGGLRYEGCTDLDLLHRDGQDQLLASCASRSEDDRYFLPNTVIPPDCGGPCPASLWRSDSAALSEPNWRLVLSETGMGRTSLARAPSNPDVVYALAASTIPGRDRDGDGLGDYDNGLHALFRSNDGGRTFAAQLRNSSADAPSTYLLSYGETIDYRLCQQSKFIYGAGWYNQALVVHPNNPEEVWAAGMDVFRSNDGGRSFGKASYWWLFRGPDSGSTSFALHADQHLLRFKPGSGGGALYVANDGGMAVSLNPAAQVVRGARQACGATGAGVQWEFASIGLNATQFYSGSVAADGSYWIAGAQDNGTRLGRGQELSSVHVYGGDGGMNAIDPRNPNLIYVSAQNTAIRRAQISASGSISQVAANTGLSDQTVFIMPFLLDPLAPDRLYAGGSGLWLSNNQGNQWARATAPLGSSFYDLVSALAISPTSETVLIGNFEGVFLAERARLSVDYLPERVSPRRGWVSSLSFDPQQAGTVYATYSSFGGAHVWRSTDRGRTWSQLDGEAPHALPDLPVHHLLVNPRDSQQLFLATDLGVYTSHNGGQHWLQSSGGFVDAITERLAIAPEAPGGARLYAFTYGRGTWSAPLESFSRARRIDNASELSGLFFDPTQNGQGFAFETITLDGVPTLLANWYVFEQGHPTWLTGLGHWQRSTDNVGMEASFELFKATRGEFPPHFRSEESQVERWGQLTVAMASADQGQASWRGPPGISGSMSLTRLARLHPEPLQAPDRLQYCHSGSWYNAAQSGHGFQLQWLGLDAGGKQRVLLLWYVYHQGKPLWLIGDGTVDASGRSASFQVKRSRGAEFPPRFNPADVILEDWGTLRFEATTLERAQVAFESAGAGFGSGELALVKLSTMVGCP
jgi:photosystem II stability/assembly factor-like uncharacterized protein